jgi:hypothetical protein
VSNVGSLYSSTWYARIGSYFSAINVWPGLIDDVRIYNRALPAAEIRRIYLGTE